MSAAQTSPGGAAMVLFPVNCMRDALLRPLARMPRPPVLGRERGRRAAASRAGPGTVARQLLGRDETQAVTDDPPGHRTAVPENRGVENLAGPLACLLLIRHEHI